MRIIILIFISCIISLTNCSLVTSDAHTSTFNLGDTLSMNYKESYFNEENNITIKFDSLISDSRCPIDVVCFWEGDAEIEFTYKKENHSARFSLHTAGSYFTKDTLLFGNSIKLVDLEPYPHSEILYEPKDYLVKIVIE